MNTETILYEVADGVAKITLNRPDKLNSFTVQMHDELKEAIKAAREDENVRCLLITGAGRGFCAGQDLGDRAVAPGGETPDLGESLEKRYNPLIRSIATLDMPVVCAINGVAAGAGANLAFACDHRAGGAFGLVHPGILQDRPRPRFRRHLVPAPPDRPGPRRRPDDDGREGIRRQGRRLGHDLEGRG